MLLDAGADINATDRVGKTALIYAIEAKKADAAKYLLELGIDAEIADNNGHKAMDFANAFGLVQLVETLSSQSASTDSSGNTPLHQACYNGRAEVVKALLAKSKSNINARNDFKRTPLCIAADENNLLIAELLIDAGADVNLSGQHGNTPLHSASFNGNEQLVKKLLAAGAAINERNESGETALIICSERGYNFIVATLLEKGADVTCADSDGHTALYYATENGSNDIVEKLIIAGAEN